MVRRASVRERLEFLSHEYELVSDFPGDVVVGFKLVTKLREKSLVSHLGRSGVSTGDRAR